MFIFFLVFYKIYPFFNYDNVFSGYIFIILSLFYIEHLTNIYYNERKRRRGIIVRNTTLEAANKEIYEIIANNIQKVLDNRGIDKSNVCDAMIENGKISVSRTTLTKFLGNPATHKIPPAFLVSFCQYFNLSLDNLFDKDYNADQEKTSQISSPIESPSDIYDSTGIFIENPESPILKNYMQTYYCYYFSTVSSENKTDQPDDAILTGTLCLEPNGNKTKATLTINTKTCNESGKPNYKIYSGKVVVCPSIQSVQCILCNKEGEFCFIIFRYSHLFFNKQECRIAEVLSTSSTSDKRYPIVHRMLLSQEKIKPIDIKHISPHLQLNYSQITISEAKLLELAELSDDYDNIVKEIFENDAELMYSFREDDVTELSEKYLSPNDIALFISELRSRSLAYRYNKVSLKADSTVRNMLKQLGYYNKNKEIVK